MDGKIVILTGAGISAESGLGTFRDEDGLWTKVPIEEVATPEAFARNPAKVHDFYNMRRVRAAEAQPNAAHHALTRLQTERPETVIVTQNVDALHERAGARVIHMHGELCRALCAACDHRWDAPPEMSPGAACPACGAPKARPDIVWFGEMPYHMEEIAGHLRAADLFVAIGTSGAVYPAAGFVEEARMAGAETLELNLNRSDVSAAFDAHALGPASEIVPAWVDEMLAR
ncbi:NAD-dependent deacetylase [Roseivivax halodurans JCM 10272]|uniref:NAD-dependent protein deacylase n=1 Tax=Roseivivax halodurans JCM 10272 TaxID=1449350 RepID=X7EDA8_9RHOB|nr:NAD-dependent deacylase [Roseivivax halodurans]ETX14069.1 NAD-dependent deacetylase [Roseivivax halodurans JCM 10272]